MNDTAISQLKHHAWRDSVRSSTRSSRQLIEELELADSAPFRDTDGPPDQQSSFPTRVPPAYLAAIGRGDPNDPLLLQVLPSRDETADQTGDADPVGDQPATVLPGVIHKYFGRVLLIGTQSCAIHCRYCFRKDFPYNDSNASRDNWAGAIQYLATRNDVNEVIVSGGDPLMLGTRRLKALTDQLSSISHIRRLRIHSRVPVVLPERVNDALVAWLTELPLQKVLVVHANHANELTSGADQALERLARTGCTLLNQSVLLRGVNDDSKTLIDLSEALFERRILPYYLHMLDLARGTRQFSVEDDRALRILTEMRTRLPGFLVPQLVREVAGEPYKLPLL